MVDHPVQTVLEHVGQFQAKTAVTCRAHVNYWALMSHVLVDLCIVDTGADSHVGGRYWLPLTPLSGPLVQFSTVTGFDGGAGKKHDLPIVEAVTKVTLNNGTSTLLRAKHLIFNEKSPHTLLSTYQMRELGMVVDDVHTRHLKDLGSFGTHSINFHHERTLDL